VLDRPGCNDAGVASHDDDARRFSTFSSVGFIAGGVLLASGVVLWLTAPRDKRSAEIKILGAF
jgi:hypothetical protein